MKGDVHDIGKNIVGVVLGCNDYEVVDLGVMVPAARILERAREIGADLVGLSGLITPSLDEMVHVAVEMERQGFTVPLLIGGATTSRTHTAVADRAGLLRPGRPRPRCVAGGRGRAVARSTRRSATAYAAGVRAEYATIRRERGERQATEHAAHPRGGAREPAPHRLGRGRAAAPLVPRRARLPELPARGARRANRLDPVLRDVGAQGALPGDPRRPDRRRRRRATSTATRLALLDRIVAEGSLRADAVVGFWPANAVGDDIVVWRDEERAEPLATFRTLRQQMAKRDGRPNLALADFVAPRESGVADFVGAFAVTAGHGVDELVAGFEAAHDDYSAILAKALADRLAEAFAERLHERVRRELWGYAPDEALANADLIAERYQGIRPAPGYPACPDHSEKRTLFELLGAEERAGIRLTESWAMHPGASVSGYYFWNPASAYFGLGRIGRDQLEDYARRAGIPVGEAARILRPNLADDAAG